MRRLRAAIPREAAGRSLIGAVAFRIVEVLGEARIALQVAQRRCRALAGARAIRTAELDGEIVPGSVRVRRIVTRRARELAGCRQRRIDECKPAELGELRGGRLLGESVSVERGWARRLVLIAGGVEGVSGQAADDVLAMGVAM